MRRRKLGTSGRSSPGSGHINCALALSEICFHIALRALASVSSVSSGVTNCSVPAIRNCSLGLLKYQHASANTLVAISSTWHFITNDNNISTTSQRLQSSNLQGKTDARARSASDRGYAFAGPVKRRASVTQHMSPTRKTESITM